MDLIARTKKEFFFLTSGWGFLMTMLLPCHIALRISEKYSLFLSKESRWMINGEILQFL